VGTLSHLTNSFLAIITKLRLAPASTAFYHTSYPSTRRFVTEYCENI
jgi:hypothetical protein